MRWTQKIGKIFQRDAYTRGVRRLRRRLHPIPLSPLLDRLDQTRLRQIQSRYADSSRQVKKYADVEYWMRVNIERVQDLHLAQGSPRDILDIGCGGGFFLYIAQQRGHHALGLDLENFSLYDELVDLLGVERRIWETKAFVPLPDLGRRFDLITAFSTGFNRHADKSLWGPKEWEFFLDDLRQHLKPGGEIFIGLNPAQGGWYYTDELRAFFLERGAEVERERVWFKVLR